jgi:hypothetical protein
MALAFLPVDDVIKGYSLIIHDFDQEDNEFLDHFERVWVGQKKVEVRVNLNISV